MKWIEDTVEAGSEIGIADSVAVVAGAVGIESVEIVEIADATESRAAVKAYTADAKPEDVEAVWAAVKRGHSPLP